MAAATFSATTKPICRSKPVRANSSRRAHNVVSANANKQALLLDYGAGNVRSLRNALKKLKYDVTDANSPADILSAPLLVFPGVGSFGPAIELLKKKEYAPYLLERLQEGKPFLGICLGMQMLFEGSEESGGVEGLGFIKGTVRRFPDSLGVPVPHIGWNTVRDANGAEVVNVAPGLDVPTPRYYFVHSYRAVAEPENQSDVALTCSYGNTEFVAAVAPTDDVRAVQFHPEKSGALGLATLNAMLSPADGAADAQEILSSMRPRAKMTSGLAKRVIACLDVRANDSGDLVVTKGDAYDVRESGESGGVRNVGKPVELAQRYYEQGADEVTFLNITGFRECPTEDQPMLEVLEKSSENVFVPLTVGGGIGGVGKSTDGTVLSPVEVAAVYFRSGADKVSIGSDAVRAALAYYERGERCEGDTSIEQISEVYGAQAVVVSIDPRRQYVADGQEAPFATAEASRVGPNGETTCWWQCTTEGGRKLQPLGAVELARAVEALGAGEILLNCIDEDGQNNGYDLALVKQVKDAVSIPVIASSGAGSPGHFVEVFEATNCSAALAAGIFHRGEVAIEEVKAAMENDGLATR